MSEMIYRHIGSETEESITPVRRGDNIIAVIGIDDYKYWRRLNNAVSDAQGVRKLFLNLGFKEVISPLYNGEATPEAINSFIQDQLRTLLKSDDSLILFFAGHGHTETSTVGETKVEAGYLIPVAGRLPEEGRLSSYIRLDSLLEDVARLPARHILVILDACYSGFAFGRAVKTLRSYERYSEDLDRRLSRHVITSAMHDQPALDNGPIPGHSLFTGTLIEALEFGKADAESKGFVTSSELALYVQKAVGAEAETHNTRQTPDFGYFEHHERGELVLSLRGETQQKQQALESLEVARRTFELAHLIGDRKRFSFAIQQYQDALKFASIAKLAIPEANLGLGKALLAVGKAGEAVKVLSELMNEGVETCPPDAGLYLGLSYAKMKEFVQAAEVLERWWNRNQQDLNAIWVGEYLTWLKTSIKNPVGRKFALLVGIDKYSLPEVANLAGSVNDVRVLMMPALTNMCGFAPDDIILLTDQAATKQRIKTEFEKLKRRTSSKDTVFIHFSGHSIPSSAPRVFDPNNQPVYLILHDTTDESGVLMNSLTASELHQWVQEIPAGHKTVVLDTHASQELIEMAKSGGIYSLILASETAEIAYEWQMPTNGGMVPSGMLTGALCQALLKAKQIASLTYQDWVTTAVQIAHEASSQYKQIQTPYFVGLPDQKVFEPEDPFYAAFEFTQWGRWPALSVHQIEMRYALFRYLISAPFPQAHFAFGRALLWNGESRKAVEAFEAAIQQMPGEYPEAWLGLGMSQIQGGLYREARQSLEKCAPRASSDLRKDFDLISVMLPRLETTRRQAVIFLMETAQNSAQVSNVLQTLKLQLQQKYGFQQDEVRVVWKEDTTKDRILTELHRARERSRDQPCLFCLLGARSYSSSAYPREDEVAFQTADGEKIELETLQEAVNQSQQLYIWLHLSSHEYPLPQRDPNALSQDEYPLSQRDDTRMSPEEVTAEYLSALVICLQKANPRRITKDEFRRGLEEAIRSIARGKPITFFSDGTQLFLGSQDLADAYQILERMEQAQIRSIARFHQDVIRKREAQGDLWPEGRLNLGVVYAALGEYEKAREELEQVIEICESGGKFYREEYAQAA